MNISNGNSFCLGNGDSMSISGLFLEGAVRNGPQLHLFDVNPIQRMRNPL